MLTIILVTHSVAICRVLDVEAESKEGTVLGTVPHGIGEPSPHTAGRGCRGALVGIGQCPAFKNSCGVSTHRTRAYWAPPHCSQPR